MIIKNIVTNTGPESGIVVVSVGDGGRDAYETFPLTLGEWKRICEAVSSPPDIGTEVDEELYDRLRAGSEYTRALRSALTSLSLSDKSTADMKKRLTSKGYSPESAVRVIALLEKKGCLDDKAAAGRAAYSLLTTKHYGKKRIAQYLLSHGFDRSATEIAVDSISDAEYRDALDTVIERRFPDIAEADGAQLRKITSALMRLGYTSDEIRGAVRDRKTER